MNEEMYIIEDVDSFLAWNKRSATSPQLKEKQARLLFDQMTNHRVELMIDKYGSLYSKEEEGNLIGISLDDVIDQVCEWNYRDIRECQVMCRNASGFVEFCKYDDLLKELRKVEKTLDKLFEQTIYGRQISERMKELAEKTWDKMQMVPVYDFPQYEDKVREEKADKEEIETVTEENAFKEPMAAVSDRTHTYEEKGRVM